MPYEVIWTDNGVIEKFSGIMSAQNLEDADKLVYDNHRFDNIRYWIVDLMEITDHTFQEDDPVIVAYIDHTASSHYKKNLNMAIASVLPSIMPLVHEYIQQSKSLVSTWYIHHFTNLKSAEDWAKS